MNTVLDFLSQHSNLIPDYLLQPQQKTIIPFLPGVPMPSQGNFTTIPDGNTPDIKEFITPDVLKKILPNVPAPEEHAKMINLWGPKYGIANKEVFPEFIAQVGHESSQLRQKDENLNYSWQRLRQVFPKYFPTDDMAKLYEHRPEKIANRVYGNRMGNGPESSGDGYRNRGGGYIMLTGDMWKLFAQYVDKTVEETQKLVRTSIEYALESAMWFFAIYKSLNDEAVRNEFLKITIAVNGGTIGEEDREVIYKRSLKVMS